MKIRTQFTLTIIIIGIMLFIISITIVLTNQKIVRVNKQIEIANNIKQDANDLGYLAMDYLLYYEIQQLSRWESRFFLLSSDLAKLKPENPEQKILSEYINSDQQRMGAIFNDIKSNLIVSSQIMSPPDPEFIRISWDRIKIQSQSIASNTLQLVSMLETLESQIRQVNLIFIIILIMALLGSFIINYIFINNRLLKSITILKNGAEIIGSGNLNYTIEIKSKDEISELSNSFNLMTLNLKKITASKDEMEREINERKKVEKALKESEGKYRFLFEKMSQPFILGEIIYENGTRPVDFIYLEVNKAWEKTMGFSKSKIIGKRAYEIFPDLDPAWLMLLAEVVEKSEPITREQFGSVTGKWFNAIAYPQKEHCFAVILEDITNQKIQEEKILSLSRFPSENPNPVLRIDDNLKIIYTNKHGNKILNDLGYDGFSIPEQLADYLNFLKKSDKIDCMSFELKIGKAFYELTMISIKDTNYFNVYGRDITEVKKAEKLKIRNLQDKILQMERKKIARELHDTVSQNLFSSNMFSESILKSWKKDPDTALNSLKIIRDLNTAAISDIHILLSNLMPEKIFKESIKDLVKILLDSLRKQPGIKTDMVIEGDYDINNKIKLEIYRIAQESFNNILKHSRATMVHVKLFLFQNEFKMVITDNGRGFDTKNKSIKKRFGLNIMKERARMIGAFLDIKSKLDGGTTITLLKKK